MDSGYNYEIDEVDENYWYQVLKKLDDVNIYQTWSYDAIRCGRKNISHLVLKKNGDIVAAAQARIVKIPYVKVGIAYIRWGPLWKLHGNKNSIEVFSQSIRALRNEYACRRGLVLRIYPILFDNNSDLFLSCLETEGFSKNKTIRKERTLIIDLDQPLDALRKGLKQKWRNCLNRAEKNELEIIEGHDDKLFEKFITIYREMIERKMFIEPNDINEFRLIQRDLPEAFKMKIYLCRFKGDICVGAIFSAIGDTGVYLLGATNNTGMKSNGSYLLQWKFIEWLKENGFSWYDLNGINPETNPGSYRFKNGLCGKNGRDVYFLGQFETWKNPLSFIFIQCSQILLAYYRKTRATIHDLSQTKR